MAADMKTLYRYSLEDVPASLQASIACLTAAFLLFVIHGFDLGACGVRFGGDFDNDVCDFMAALFWPLIVGAIIFPPIITYAQKQGFDHIDNCLLILLVSGLLTTLFLPLIVPIIMPDTFLAGVMAGFVFSTAKNIANAQSAHRSSDTDKDTTVD
ncbi:MAG: hypothetical protein AAFR39_02990 [Pseudomonadota bacterium]